MRINRIKKKKKERKWKKKWGKTFSIEQVANRIENMQNRHSGIFSRDIQQQLQNGEEKMESKKVLLFAVSELYIL